MKSKRQRHILEIISTYKIETQEELAEYLRDHGIEVTQATVSRDIKELGLIKVPMGDNRYCYAKPAERTPGVIDQRQQRMFRESVIKIAASENLIVIKTLTGSAQGVAAVVDGLAWPEIIGTVAGDDTIIMVIRTRLEVEAVVAKLESLRE
ncbi:MAG: arginine repressor [bacterium]|jgi:transcriptional regulator of arginine metabolism